LGGISGRLFGFVFLVMAFGLWKIISGLVGVMMAPHKKGSLADEG